MLKLALPHILFANATFGKAINSEFFIQIRAHEQIRQGNCSSRLTLMFLFHMIRFYEHLTRNSETNAIFVNSGAQLRKINSNRKKHMC